jgi:hypothetical protein
LTEADWGRSKGPVRMLRFLSSAGKADDRKCRLFACACCRRVWGRLPAQANRDLVVAVEECPVGTFDDPELHAAICASSAEEEQSAAEPAMYLGRGLYKLTAAESAVEVATRVACLVADEDRPAPEVDLNDDEAFVNYLVNCLVPPPARDLPSRPACWPRGRLWPCCSAASSATPSLRRR